MKLSNLILLSIASLAFFYIQLWDPQVVTPLFVTMLTVCAIYGVYAKDINIIHISGIMLLLTCIEYISFETGLINYITPSENKLLQGTLIYGVQFLFTMITALALILRVQLSRLISKSKQIELTYFDGLFHWIFMYMAVVNLLALIENIIWSSGFKSWTFIYDNFEGLIYIAWAICCGAVLTMMICSAKSNDSQEPRLS
ncbi:hypothetical protein [Pseudoalteromonas maricaloris]|uniref:hypothetical protein n=1 Tax=Pseudoalteromonas maricaloris TaxID=184924 RepID=UPI00057F890A|nr:hypothetical protein [Pseudoalteromonas flavipulchra]KID32735.1 hypothetical protein QT15_19905 [Pseudoalteromonas flavipulchra NCIMB 2033 = ATCC BAA-314]MBD0780880.1 hypothetical protein [Pseudoalteromonas flavipulchra]MBE0373782.1 hypothetical protein [Pseudoalteromonas flavipulchra NCIMB 2033 = ATCC BAA-314]